MLNLRLDLKLLISNGKIDYSGERKWIYRIKTNIFICR